MVLTRNFAYFCTKSLDTVAQYSMLVRAGLCEEMQFGRSFGAVFYSYVGH